MVFPAGCANHGMELCVPYHKSRVTGLTAFFSMLHENAAEGDAGQIYKIQLEDTNPNSSSPSFTTSYSIPTGSNRTSSPEGLVFLGLFDQGPW